MMLTESPDGRAAATSDAPAHAPPLVRDLQDSPNAWYAKLVQPLLNDPRDSVFVGLLFQCALCAALGVGLFFSGPWFWYLAPVYLVIGPGLHIDRFTLMLHCTSHRQLFKKKYRFLNALIPWVVGPFYGQTPETYFAHHIGMHHAEENLRDDLSSTMRFQRDRFGDWLKYCGRFLTLGLVDLARYMAAHRRVRLFRRVVVGEVGYLLAFAGLVWLRPGAALVVFGVPLIAIRVLMMVGNWGQHAFIAPTQPESAHLASITCINSRYNSRCFNDGYHIGHHLDARAHWTEYPGEFIKNAAEYGRNDAIVFEGLDFFLVWLYLMTGRWSWLARRFVRLPGAPERSEAEVIAFLRTRVRPIL